MPFYQNKPVGQPYARVSNYSTGHMDGAPAVEAQKPEGTTSYLEGLNPQQYTAVTHKEGPLLILAGAGSGKTRVLIHRVAYLVDHGVNPGNILLLTFTNQAAREMRERAEKLLDPRCGLIAASTFHSFCATLLRKYAGYTDFTSNFTILSAPEAQDAVGLVKAQEGEVFAKKRGFPNNKTISGIISSSVNRELPIEDVCDKEYEKYKGFIGDITAIANMYSTYKIEHNLMDYDDLLVKFLRLLETHEQIRQVISRQYQYVMVDEYQDTNRLQERILEELCKDTWNLTVVGDDAQSIYAFRGADIKNILSFPEKIPGCKVVALEQNYRSVQEILDFANVVMDHHSTMGFRKHMFSGKDLSNQELPRVIRPADMSEEAERAMGQIRRWLSQGVPRQEIAVMARGSASFFRLETLLTKEGVPYKKLGGLKFLEHACIQDVLAYLRCLANPLDQLAWYRVLQKLPGIGETYASRLAALSHVRSDFLTENKYRRNQFYPELRALAKEIKVLQDTESFEEELKEALRFYIKLRQRLVDEGKYQDESARTERQETLDKDIETLDLMTEIALEYPSAIQFLDAVTLDATGKDLSRQKDPLTLTTIHSAKGLEFQSVIILDCCDGVFPKNTADDAGSFEEQEELRCFYVAITRAKENLVLYSPKRGSVYGKWQDYKPSHFLEGTEDAADVDLGDSYYFF